MLTLTEMQTFKELLETQLVELGSKAGDTMTHLLGQSIGAADLLDLSAMDAERNFTLQIQDRESKLIRKIKSALQRIEEGTYGECEGCGEDIAVARLQARPVTAYCIGCKTRKESSENMGFFTQPIV